MKLFKRKHRDTEQAAGELFQFEQLTSVVPADIEASDEIRSFIRLLPKDVEDKLKHCGADHLNTEMFNKRIHAAFQAEADRITGKFDHNLSTIHTICQIQRGRDVYMTGLAKLYADDIAAAEEELERLMKKIL